MMIIVLSVQSHSRAPNPGRITTCYFTWDCSQSVSRLSADYIQSYLALSEIEDQDESMIESEDRFLERYPTSESANNEQPIDDSIEGSESNNLVLLMLAQDVINTFSPEHSLCAVLFYNPKQSPHVLSQLEMVAAKLRSLTFPMAAAICDSEHSCSELEVAENLPEIWYFQNGLRIAHTSPDCSNDIQRFILTETTRALHGKLSEVKRGRTLHIKGSFKVRKNTELCGGKARAITWTMNITSSKTDTVSKRVPVVQIFDEKNDLQQFHNDNAESMVLYYYPDCKTDDLIMFAIVSKEVGIEVAKVDCKKSQSACYSEE
eukprot:444143_1